MIKAHILLYAAAVVTAGCASITHSPTVNLNITPCEVPAELVDRASVEAPLSEAAFTRTTSLESVHSKALDLAKTQSVLVVFDIDDTLLTNKPVSEVGSTAWYNWQSKLLSEGSGNPCSAAKGPNRFNELFDLIDLSYLLLDLQPTESEAASILSDLSAAGVATHALTARSPKYIGATLRELDDNGMSFHAPQSVQPKTLAACDGAACMDQGMISHLATERFMVDVFGCAPLIGGNTKFSGFSGGKTCDGYRKPAAPYSTDRVFASGRETVISNGVMSVEGQNKGLMLEYLLQSFGDKKFDHVIFVDDSPGNIAKIFAVKNLADPDSRIHAADLTLFYYDQFETHSKFLGSVENLSHAKSQLDTLVCTVEPYGQITDSMDREC